MDDYCFIPYHSKPRAGQTHTESAAVKRDSESALPRQQSVSHPATPPTKLLLRLLSQGGLRRKGGRSRVAVAPPFGMLLDLGIGFADSALVGIRDRE